MIKNSIIGLAILGMTSGLHAKSLDPLCEAVQKTKLEEVRNLTKGLAISRRDKEALLDFAQNIISQRLADYECFKVRPFQAHMSDRTLLLAGGLILILFGSLQSKSVGDKHLSNEWLPVCFIAFIASRIKDLWDAQGCTESLYSDSITIKNLIYQISEN